MKVHPAARAFPLLEGEEFESFVQDIKAHGQQAPIVFHGEVLLDGRNRWRACNKLGIEPRSVQWEGNGSSATAYVISANLRRRHLTPSQLATVAAELLPEFKKEAKERQREHGKTAPGKKANTPANSGGSEARDAAAAAVGVSHTYVDQASALEEKAPELFVRVKAGEITLSKAVREVRKAEAPTVEEEVDRQPGMKWARLIADLGTLALSVNKHGISRIAAKWTAERKRAVRGQIKRLIEQLSKITEELA